jgi:hypothetical protein
MKSATKAPATVADRIQSRKGNGQPNTIHAAFAKNPSTSPIPRTVLGLPCRDPAVVGPGGEFTAEHSVGSSAAVQAPHIIVDPKLGLAAQDRPWGRCKLRAGYRGRNRSVVGDPDAIDGHTEAATGVAKEVEFKTFYRRATWCQRRRMVDDI